MYYQKGVQHSHIPHVSFHSEGEAASDLRVLGVGIGVLERAAGQDGLLGMVKGDSTELLPVGDERRLSDDFVQRNVTLHFALIHATIG